MKKINSKLNTGHIAKTISDYNLIADKFSNTRLNITTDLQKLAALIPKGARVLDYGCGNGRMAELFQPDKYFGVDPSKELIKHAKKLHPDYKFRLIEAGERIEEKFDAVLCLAVIHHLPDKESHRNLIDILSYPLNLGGMLILTTWELTDEPRDEIGLVHKPFVDGSATIDRALYPFSHSELEGLISDYGFEVIRSQIEPRNSGIYSNIEIIATKRF